MAQKTIVQIFDDLDGSTGDDIRPIEFALDGVTYEIDLNEVNAARLRAKLAEFVAAARRNGGRVRRSSPLSVPKPRPDARSKEQTRAVREWARRTGHDVSERGRIPGSILEAFEEAHRTKGAKTKAAAFSS